MSYPFRLDDGSIYEASYEEMMEAQDGFLTLPDGRVARRVREPSSRRSTPERNTGEREEVSDALGFAGAALPEMEAHRVLHGHVGVTFTQDPQVPGFYQARGTRTALEKYSRDRGYGSRGTAGKVHLSAVDLERAREISCRQFIDSVSVNR